VVQERFVFILQAWERQDNFQSLCREKYVMPAGAVDPLREPPFPYLDICEKYMPIFVGVGY